MPIWRFPWCRFSPPGPAQSWPGSEPGAALVASQLKFSALFHSSPVAMTVSSRSRGYAVVDVNDAWERQFCRERSEIIGRSGADVRFWCSLDDRTEVLRLIEAAGRFATTRRGCSVATASAFFARCPAGWSASALRT